MSTKTTKAATAVQVSAKQTRPFACFFRGHLTTALSYMVLAAKDKPQVVYFLAGSGSNKPQPYWTALCKVRPDNDDDDDNKQEQHEQRQQQQQQQQQLQQSNAKIAITKTAKQQQQQSQQAATQQQ